MKRLGNLVDWLQRQGEYPYVAEYKVSAAFDESQIKLAQFKKLLSFEMAVSGADGRLLTFWKDEKDYHNFAVGFLVALRLIEATTALGWAGAHRDGKGRTPKLWRRLLTWQNVAGVGGILAIAAYFTNIIFLFVAAEATPLPASKNILVGQPINLEIGIQNTARFSDFDVVWQPVVAVTPGNNGLQIDPIATLKLGLVKPNEKGPVHITGKALRAGKYKIEVHGTARGGLLSYPNALKASAEVKVWNPIDIGKPTSNPGTNPKVCQALVHVLVGLAAKYGLEMSAGLEGEAGVHFGWVIGDGTLIITEQKPPFYLSPKPEKTVASLYWKTGPLEAMSESDLVIYLESDGPKNRAEWQAIVDKLEKPDSAIILEK